MSNAKNALRLTADGKSAYIIVYGQDATPSEKTAASELQKYLLRISGAELPVVTDSTPPAEKEIVVGKTNREYSGQFDRKAFKNDGFVICTVGKKLFVVGGEKRGTLYGVYTFLEEYLGCRFYTRHVEKIPHTPTVEIAEITEDKQTPQFLFRDIAWYDYTFTDISVKRKVNFCTWDRELPEEVGGGISYTGCGGHTFFLLVDPDTYFDMHPEYFSMNEKGVRVRDRQLCLTNPDVLAIAKKSARKLLREHPDAAIISISQEDTTGACLCENCKKVYKEEGGAFSGAVLRFVNEIARDLKDDYPDVWVDTYAYSYTRSAPTKTKPDENVMIRLCTMGCCFSHTHDKLCKTQSGAAPTYLDGTGNTFPEDMDAWGAISENNFVYDYSTNFQHYFLTFPDLHNLQYNINWYAKNNAIGVMMEGNSHSKSGELGDVRSYLLSKLLWKPTMDREEYDAHMDDFLQGVYGSGGKYLRKYIELAEELTKDICFDLVSDPRDVYPLLKIQNHGAQERPDLTPEAVKSYKTTDWEKYALWYEDVAENRITSEGAPLFLKAMKSAETEEQRERLNELYCQVEYIRSYYLWEKNEAKRRNITKVVSDVIAAHPDAFTETEKKNLPAQIAEFALTAAVTEYTAYNRALCEKMVAKGFAEMFATLYYEEFHWRDFDFSRVPAARCNDQQYGWWKAKEE